MPVDDKKSFAERLKTALKRLPKSIETAAELANQFDLNHRNEPITPQAAQKLLQGNSYSKADKLETLAEWLNVSARWLKIGPPPPLKKPPFGKRGQPAQAGFHPLS